MLNIKPRDVSVSVSSLSGGNRQKVVLARWLFAKPRLLMFDEPTAGIDVGSRHEIYRLIDTLAGEGIGILMISSELPELLGMCDRIAVMCEGRIRGILTGEEATQEKILTLATPSNEGTSYAA
jgi:ABC-type sugar transport system ATPase subunit